jgi:hypothetical protein
MTKRSGLGDSMELSQVGLSHYPPPPRALALVNSSSEEEEEEEGSDGRRAAPERWNPPPPSPQAVEAAVELVPTAGAEAPVGGLPVEVPAGQRARQRRPPSPRGRGSGAFQLELSSVFPYAPLISRGWRSSLSLSC